MELDYQNQTNQEIDYDIEKTSSQIIEETFLVLGIKPIYLVNLTLIDDETIHKLNKEYRQIDRPTDVLSFAFLEAEDGKIPYNDEQDIDLGEILISLDTASRQAKEYNHSLKRELSFLFVHGLLHLLGFDHQNEEDEKKMFNYQNEILEKVGIKK